VRSTPRRILLASVCVLSLGLASSAQTPFGFTIDQSQSNWTYSGTATVLGQTGNIVGNPSNSFQVFGDASGILTGGGSPIATAQFAGANAMVTPDIDASLEVPLPFGGAIAVATIKVTNLVFDLQSTVGTVSSSGSVTADVTLAIVSGTATLDIIGFGVQSLDLAGLFAPATTFTGQLTGDGSSFTFDTTQLTSSIDVSDPTLGLAATLMVTGQVVSTYDCPAALVGSPNSISITSGGTQSLTLSTCVEQANSLFFIVGSASGSSPGIPIGPGQVLPLNIPDPYFDYTLLNPAGGLLSPGLSVLDASGVGLSSFTLPAGLLNAPAAGLQLNHAYVAFDSTATLTFVSNAAPLTLTL